MIYAVDGYTIYRSQRDGVPPFEKEGYLRLSNENILARVEEFKMVGKSPVRDVVLVETDEVPAYFRNVFREPKACDLT